jgi:hypothetical protein
MRYSAINFINSTHNIMMYARHKLNISCFRRYCILQFAIILPVNQYGCQQAIVLSLAVLFCSTRK